MKSSISDEVRLLLSNLDRLVVERGNSLDTQDLCALEDVALIRSYADQLRHAVEASSAAEVLQAINRARSINKGLGDRVWTKDHPWIGSTAFEIMQQAVRLHGLLVGELGGLDAACGINVARIASPVLFPTARGV